MEIKLSVGEAHMVMNALIDERELQKKRYEELIKDDRLDPLAKNCWDAFFEKINRTIKRINDFLFSEALEKNEALRN
jgi:hypothetical protein